MKKVILILLGVVVVFLCVKNCGGHDEYNETDEMVDESNIDQIRERVESAEGNVITLESGLRVRVIGVANNNSWVESYLKAHVVGKDIALVADRQIKNHMEDYDEEIPAYVILDETKPSVNHQIVIDNPRAFDASELADSLEVMRPKKGKTEEITDLALYMKMRSFLIQVPGGLGTGFFINDQGLALTNNHVLPDGQGVAYLYNDKAHDDSEIYAERERQIEGIIYTDPVLDITIFKVRLDPNEKVDYFDLADKHVPQGTRIATYGNPYGLTGSFTSGDLSAYRDVEERPLVQYSMATNPGNSGGPVADPTGKVVAIHDLGAKDMQNVNYGIDILAVRKVLDKHQLKYGGL
ncbi:MAG: serine protease [Muribaculaceae bacterium]|nr:serine protease [Muribaculaceae bacterium]